jgi:hypothetical protein
MPQDIDAFTGQQKADLEAVLKEVYEPQVQELINRENALLDELSSTDRGVNKVGKHAVVGLEIADNVSAAPRGEYELLPEPGKQEYERSLIKLTNQYSSGALTGVAEAHSDDEKQSLVEILGRTVRGVTAGAQRSVNRQAWLSTDGAIATIAAVEGAGTGDDPFVVTVDEKQVFLGKWISRNERIQFGSVSGGSATVQNGVAKVVSVDRASSQITAITVSGTNTPDEGDSIFVEGSANNSLAGLSQIISNTDDTFQNVDPNDVPEWKAVRKDSEGEIKVDLLNQLGNEIQFESGSRPELYLTTFPIQTALYDELFDQVRFANPESLKKSLNSVILPDGRKLRAVNEAKRGSVYAINPQDIQIYHTGDWNFLTQGDSRLMRFDRRDAVELVLRRYMQVGVRKRHSHGELYGIDESTDF